MTPQGYFREQEAARTVVQACNLGGEVCEGLFADENIAQNRLVARMESCVITTPAQWRAHQERHKLPDDAHVDWQGGGRVRACYDDTFTDPSQPKSWYKMNHSCRPNAALHMESNRICFFSLCCIPKGEQITFRYSQQHSEFPSEWCDCEPKSRTRPGRSRRQGWGGGGAGVGVGGTRAIPTFTQGKHGCGRDPNRRWDPKEDLCGQGDGVCRNCKKRERQHEADEQQKITAELRSTHSTSTSITMSWSEMESPNPPNLPDYVRRDPAATTTTTTTPIRVSPFQTPPPVAPPAGDAPNFEVEDCPICQQSLVAQEAATLPCGHNFHRSCVIDWLKVFQEQIPPLEPTCPNCRKIIDGEYLTREKMPGHARQHGLMCQQCFLPIAGRDPFYGLGRRVAMCGHWFHHECFVQVRLSVLQEFVSPDDLFSCPHCQGFFAQGFFGRPIFDRPN